MNDNRSSIERSYQEANRVDAGIVVEMIIAEEVASPSDSSTKVSQTGSQTEGHRMHMKPAKEKASKGFKQRVYVSYNSEGWGGGIRCLDE